jgi:hypothetical protein
MPDSLDAHYKTVIEATTDGWRVPFLGTGVNLCSRLARTRSPTERCPSPTSSKMGPPADCRVLDTRQRLC